MAQGQRPTQSGAIRTAGPQDAPALFEIRRDAIRILAPRGMTEEAARRWADARTLEWIAGMIGRRAVWVFEFDGVVVGWISATNDLIDGLYTSPAYEQRGVGSQLLAYAETAMAGRGVSEVRLESSWNAEAFYLRRGYAPEYPRTADGTLLMRKRLPGPVASPSHPRIELLAFTPQHWDFAFRVTEAAMRPHVERAFGTWDANRQQQLLEESLATETWSIVLVDGEHAGILAVHDRAEEIFLSRIFLLPEFQHQGLGSTLIRQLLARAHGEGKPVRLRVLRVNRAKALYERLGFSVTQSTPDHYYMEYRARQAE